MTLAARWPDLGNPLKADSQCRTLPARSGNYVRYPNCCPPLLAPDRNHGNKMIIIEIVNFHVLQFPDGVLKFAPLVRFLFPLCCNFPDYPYRGTCSSFLRWPATLGMMSFDFSFCAPSPPPEGDVRWQRPASSISRLGLNASSGRRWPTFTLVLLKVMDTFLLNNRSFFWFETPSSSLLLG